MATPTTPEMQRMALKAVLEWPARLEAERKRLLGMWVSELEPVEVWDGSGLRFVGLTVKGRRTLPELIWPAPVVLKAFPSRP